jgi:AcrR family transcriptional regulator
MAENRTKKERKYQIMEAALSVFVRRGYTNTRMDDIVKESGLSKGAIYHHYESKKDLFLSLIDHWETHSFPDFYSKNGRSRTATNTLRDFAQAILEIFNSKKHLFLAEIEFWSLSNQDIEVRERSQALYEKLINLFELVLQKGIRNGEFKKIDTRLTALFILSSFQGINWFCMYNEEKIKPEDYLCNSIDILLENIKK